MGVVKLEIYDGSIESGKLLLKNMDIKFHKYFFNLETQELTVDRNGTVVTFRPGDSYYYKLQEIFKVIG